VKTLHPALDEVPVYVKASSIVPRQALVQSTGETPAGPLELRVYPGPDCKGALYQDDGHSLNFQKDEFLRVSYSCQTGASAIKVISTIEKDGYKPWWSTAEIIVYGLEKAPKSLRIGDAAIHEWRFDPQQHAVIFSVPDAKSNWTAELVL